MLAELETFLTLMGDEIPKEDCTKLLETLADPEDEWFLPLHSFLGQIVRQVNQSCHALQRSATRIKRPIIQNRQKQLKFKQLKICVNNIHTTVNRGSKNRL